MGLYRPSTISSAIYDLLATAAGFTNARMEAFPHPLSSPLVQRRPADQPPALRKLVLARW